MHEMALTSTRPYATRQLRDTMRHYSTSAQHSRARPLSLRDTPFGSIEYVITKLMVVPKMQGRYYVFIAIASYQNSLPRCECGVPICAVRRILGKK